MSDYIERKSIRNLYSCLNPNDRVLVGQVLIDIDAIPSVDTPTTMTGVIDAIREAEYRGCMKAVEDRPKGEWMEREVLEDTVINEWQSARCSECAKYHTTPYMYYFDNFNFCPNCGADMRGERADEHGRNKSADRQ